MAYEQTDLANSQSQDASKDGDKEKLFFGKYKTIEDAESAYKEGERKMHEATQQAAQWKEIAEKREATLSDETAYGRGQQYVTPQTDSGQAAQVLSRFYQDPIGVLREVKDTAAAEAEQRWTKRQREEANNRDRVQAWLAKNPDLAPHGDLLDFYVRQTDGRLAVESRLDAGGSKVRARLVELRGAPGEANPNPEDYIPGPSGRRDGGGHDAPRPVLTTLTAESELAKYAAERNASRMKRPGQHGRT